MAKQTEKKQHLKKIKITGELKVELIFGEKATTNEVDEGGKEKFINNEYSAKSNYIPSDDLVAALRDLRKHALKLSEFDVKGGEIKKYMVNELRINGTLEEKNARVSMVLIKKLSRTRKPLKIAIDEVAVFDPSEYKDGADIVEMVKKITKEVWLYMGGKHLGEEQLSLFNKA